MTPTIKKAREVRIPSGSSVLEGELNVPTRAIGIVLFAHGSGSSRFSPRNQFVAQLMNKAGIGTLLFDLLTADEEAIDARTQEFRFNIELLSERLEDATYWLDSDYDARHLKVGYFGASTGAAAALAAAARLDGKIAAVVSRGGRPDLAAGSLAKVTAPTLLLVGAQDTAVIGLNENALAQLPCKKQLQLIPDATHLFEETGTLEEMAHVAIQWFGQQLLS